MKSTPSTWCQIHNTIPLPVDTVAGHGWPGERAEYRENHPEKYQTDLPRQTDSESRDQKIQKNKEYDACVWEACDRKPKRSLLKPWHVWKKYNRKNTIPLPPEQKSCSSG
jgi:hypothetical protein